MKNEKIKVYKRKFETYFYQLYFLVGKLKTYFRIETIFMLETRRRTSKEIKIDSVEFSPSFFVPFTLHCFLNILPFVCREFLFVRPSKKYVHDCIEKLPEMLPTMKCSRTICCTSKGLAISKWKTQKKPDKNTTRSS